MRVSGKTSRAVVSLAIYTAFYTIIGLTLIILFEAAIRALVR